MSAEWSLNKNNNPDKFFGVITVNFLAKNNLHLMGNNVEGSNVTRLTFIKMTSLHKLRAYVPNAEMPKITEL